MNNAQQSIRVGLFFLHSTFLEFVDLPFPATWKEHADAVYAGSSQCNIPWKLLVDPALQLLLRGITASMDHAARADA